MANIFPAQAKVHPSFSEPELIAQYFQASGAFATLYEGKPRVRMGAEDLFVYVNELNIRSQSIGSQFAAEFLPSATLQAEFLQTATYLLRTRAIYDRHDIAAAARYAVGLPMAQELAMRQGIFNQLRSMLLYGFNAANNEGLLNAQGITSTNLPADTYGNDTVVSYDNGQMALYILQQIVELKTRMFQSGSYINNKIVILSPQREFLQFQYGNIVQVTSYQRPGGGTATTAEVIKTVAQEAGDSIEWYYDDTLIGQGPGGTDAVIITIPEIERPVIPGINTNVFGAEFEPATTAVNVQYTDVAAPIKIATPTPDGAVTEILEQRATSGWCWRPQGVTVIGMTYN